jgi:hypothetical protein
MRELSLEVICYVVIFQVLTAANMKMAVFWDVAPSSLVEICRRFRASYSL